MITLKPYFIRWNMYIEKKLDENQFVSNSENKALTNNNVN